MSRRPSSSAAALARRSSRASSSSSVPCSSGAPPAGSSLEVDLVAVPAQLPGDHDRTTLSRCSAGRTLTSGAPSERATPATRRGMLARVEDLDRARDRSPAVHRRRAAASASARRRPRGSPCAAASAASTWAPPCGLAAGGAPRAGRRRRSGARVERRGRRTARGVAPAVRRAVAAPREPRPPAWRRRSKSCARGAGASAAAQRRAPSLSRIQPSCGGAGAHSSHTVRRCPAARNTSWLLAAQQPPLAHVAGDVGLGGDDRAGCHRPSRVRRARRACALRGRRSGVRGRALRAGLLDDLLREVRRAPPRSAGTPACSRPGPAVIERRSGA